MIPKATLPFRFKTDKTGSDHPQLAGRACLRDTPGAVSYRHVAQPAVSPYNPKKTKKRAQRRRSHS